MAYQVKLEEAIPDTLPADFGEWDSAEPPVTLPDNFDDFDAAPVSDAAATQPAKAANMQPYGMHVVARLPIAAASLKPAAVYADAQIPESFQPVPVSLFRGQESGFESESKHKKTVMFVAAGSTLLLLIVISLMYLKPRPSTAVPDQSHLQQPATATLPTPETKKTKPKPSPSGETATEAEQTPSVPSEMMNDQLNAPTRIPREIKVPEKEAPPLSSGFAVAGVDGLSSGDGGAIGTVFKGQTGPKVQAEVPKIVNVSSGVAQGMLINKGTPVYPEIAKEAHVTGTVVVEATISKTGVVEGVHAVSGPEMLRHAASDAVRTWRYRPYKLNNQPVEVQTTVTVIFSLGN